MFIKTPLYLSGEHFTFSKDRPACFLSVFPTNIYNNLLSGVRYYDATKVFHHIVHQYL